MYTIKYKDTHGHIVTDKTNSLVVYSAILRVIRKHDYELIVVMGVN